MTPAERVRKKVIGECVSHGCAFPCSDTSVLCETHRALRNLAQNRKRQNRRQHEAVKP